jgi:hypothetical protein
VFGRWGLGVLRVWQPAARTSKWSSLPNIFDGGTLAGSANGGETVCCPGRSARIPVSMVPAAMLAEPGGAALLPAVSRQIHGVDGASMLAVVGRRRPGPDGRLAGPGSKSKRVLRVHSRG